MPSPLIGYSTFGAGPKPVLVMHEWFCDHTGWDAVMPYLTASQFTYVFADLRGYGSSRELDGSCTLDEAAGDAVALADHLAWDSFSLIGHSMSGLVVQRIAQMAPARIERLIAVTPVSPGGAHLDADALGLFRSMALADDEARFSMLNPLWGTRLSETWLRYKLRRWRETANPRAVAKYVDLWGTAALSPGPEKMTTPMLVIAGEKDAPWFRSAALQASFPAYFSDVQFISLEESGHYPMQEQPPLLATEIERFLNG